MGASWKTTVCGIIVIAGGIALVVLGNAVLGSTVIMAGLGLIAAKDSNVTGGTKPQ